MSFECFAKVSLNLLQIFAEFAIFSIPAMFVKIATFQGAPLDISFEFWIFTNPLWRLLVRQSIIFVRFVIFAEFIHFTRAALDIFAIPLANARHICLFRQICHFEEAPFIITIEISPNLLLLLVPTMFVEMKPLNASLFFFLSLKETLPCPGFVSRKHANVFRWVSRGIQKICRLRLR